MVKSMYGNGGANIWDYFCNHACLMDYMAKHTQAVISIEPRREPLETPIKDPVKDEYKVIIINGPLRKGLDNA